MTDVATGIGLSGYVPTSRTLSINGVTYDLTANRSWTITTPYVSKLQHQVKAGVAINKGQAVYVTGADGTNMVVGLASNASEATSSKTMGLLDATVSTNGFANVVTEGLLAGLNTSAAGSEGDPVWLGTGGNLIYGLTNKPYAPAHLVFIGIVTRKNANNGEIFVKVQNGFELNEIHDVDLKTNLPTAGQLLRYDSDGLWKNWSPNYLTAESDTLATVTSRGATTSTPVTFNGNVTLGNSADLVFQDLAGTFPTSGKGFDWTLNNDGARIYAIQPSSDSIDFVFQLRDNATTNDRFVFWVDEWQGPAFDKYPLIISGGTEFDLKDSSLYTNTVLRLSNSGVLQNVTGNISMFTNNVGYLTSYTETDTLATVTGRGATTTSAVTVGTSLSITGPNRTVSMTSSSNYLHIQAYAGSSNGAQLWLGNDNDPGFYVNANQHFFRGLDSSNKMYIDGTSGNVGIGTTSPSKKLQIGISNAIHADEGILLQSPGGYGEGAIYHDYGQSTGVTAFKILNTYSGSQIALSQDGYSSTGSPGSIRLYTAASGGSNTPVERMRITSDGNVGIGTTSPASRFQSNNVSTYNSSTPTGAILASNLAAGNAVIDIGVDANYLGYIQSRNVLNTTPYNLLLNPIGGNVGIGVTNPSYKLDVNGSFNFVTSGVYLTYNSGVLYHGDYYQFPSGSYYYLYGRTGMGLIFGSNNAEVGRFDLSGNLGIGTTSPTAKLHTVGTGIVNIVQSSNTVSYTQYYNTSTGTNSTNDGLTVGLNGIDAYVFSREAGNLILGTLDTERVRITSAGLVGIGTSSPGAKLHVAGGEIRVDAGQAVTLDIANSMYLVGASNQLRLYNGGNPVVNITTGGNVGIGTTNPVSKLSIAGPDNASGLGVLELATFGGTNLKLGGNNTYSWIQSHSSKPLYINELGNGVILNLGGGAVGIGTASPFQQFHITQNMALGLTGGSIGDTNSILFPTVNGTHAGVPNGIYYTKKGNWGGQIDIRTSYDWGYSTDNAKISLNGAAGNGITFSTGASALGSTERVRIDELGNVGIGTTSPSATLDILTGSSESSGNSFSFTGYNSKTYVSISKVGFIRSRASDLNGANMHFLDNGGTTRMEIAVNTTSMTWYSHALATDFLVFQHTTGNIGIGTTSPSYKLDVTGGIRATAFSVFGAAVQFQAYMELIGGSPFYLFSAGNTYYSTISQNGQNLILSPDTNVGIGTILPSTKLDVNGVITATGGNSTNWNTAYGWGNHSSAGYVPQARTLTINGTSYDLSANRSWTIATTTPGGSNTQFQYNSSGTLAGASALTYNSATNRVGINQASPGYDLDVNGQVRVQDKLRVGTVNSGNGVVHMSSTATINPSATTIVWSQNVSVGMCAFIEYYILNNNTTTDQRAGTIMVTWNQSGTPTIAHTETTTPDIGSTTAINFTSSLVGSDARINAVNSSSAPYTIVMSYKYF
jgi:hypothetical protein